MAPTLELETIGEELPEIEERDRVLIAAAAAAVVGSGFRIVEIKRAGEGKRRGGEGGRPYMDEVLRAGSRSRNGAHAGGRWV